MAAVFGIMFFGGLGSLFRWIIVQRWAVHPMSFPWGVFAVNILGSFAIGYLFESRIISDRIGSIWEPLIVVGFLGGFTTFSSFSLDSMRLWQSGAFFYSIINVLVNNIGGLLACYMGTLLVSK